MLAALATVLFQNRCAILEFGLARTLESAHGTVHGVAGGRDGAKSDCKDDVLQTIDKIAWLLPACFKINVLAGIKLAMRVSPESSQRGCQDHMLDEQSHWQDLHEDSAIPREHEHSSGPVNILLCFSFVLLQARNAS